MKPGTKAYKTWLASLKVGDRVQIENKVYDIEFIGGAFVEIANYPSIDNMFWRDTGRFGLTFGPYLLPVPNTLHQNTTKQNSKAAYMASKPKHKGHKERILKAIARSTKGMCIYGIAKSTGLQPVQVARRMKELHSPHGEPLIEQTDRLVCRHCKHSSGITHWVKI